MLEVKIDLSELHLGIESTHYKVYVHPQKWYTITVEYKTDSDDLWFYITYPGGEKTFLFCAREDDDYEASGVYSGTLGFQWT